MTMLAYGSRGRVDRDICLDSIDISFLADKVTTALALVAVMSITTSPASLIEPFWLVIDTALPCCGSW